MIKPGSKFKNFKLFDQAGNQHELSRYLGGWVLLYFYPADDTPGCTKEACEIRDNWQAFADNNITVLGVSVDSVESHKKFASKHNLPFTLLADPEGDVVKMYEAQGDSGKAKRVSYLIDPDGLIAKVYSAVKPDQHADEVLRDVAIFTD